MANSANSTTAEPSTGGCAFDLISSMEAVGFVREPQGGGFEVMVQRIARRCIVVTGGDGADLPDEDDFLVVVYEGEWTEQGAAELYSATAADIPECPASGLSPIDEALDQARKALERPAPDVGSGERRS